MDGVSEISKLSDDGKSKFGDFSLGIDKSASGGTLTTAGVAIYAKRGDSDTAVETGGKLYLRRALMKKAQWKFFSGGARLS